MHYFVPYALCFYKVQRRQYMCAKHLFQRHQLGGRSSATAQSQVQKHMHSLEIRLCWRQNSKGAYKKQWRIKPIKGTVCCPLLSYVSVFVLPFSLSRSIFSMGCHHQPAQAAVLAVFPRHFYVFEHKCKMPNGSEMKTYGHLCELCVSSQRCNPKADLRAKLPFSFPGWPASAQYKWHCAKNNLSPMGWPCKRNTTKCFLHKATADHCLCEHVWLESKKSSFFFNIWHWHEIIFVGVQLEYGTPATAVKELYYLAEQKLCTTHYGQLLSNRLEKGVVCMLWLLPRVYSRISMIQRRLIRILRSY